MGMVDFYGYGVASGLSSFGGFFWRWLIIIHGLLLIVSLSMWAEAIYRFLIGVRPLRTNKEKERLIPLFEEVYSEAFKKAPTLYKGIKLYILESMEVNAFAFGKRTLCMTRGSMTLLNDDCLKGLIAHEFGHFANGDTKMGLIILLVTLPVSLLLNMLSYLARIFKPFNIIYQPVQLIYDVIFMSGSRKREYKADRFAHESGYREELTAALYELYLFIVEKPGSIEEQIRRTHPELTKRIERLENM